MSGDGNTCKHNSTAKNTLKTAGLLEFVHETKPWDNRPWIS